MSTPIKEEWAMTEKAQCIGIDCATEATVSVNVRYGKDSEREIELMCDACLKAAISEHIKGGSGYRIFTVTNIGDGKAREFPEKNPFKMTKEISVIGIVFGTPDSAFVLLWDNQSTKFYFGPNKPGDPPLRPVRAEHYESAQDAKAAEKLAEEFFRGDG
jgi:hypothetical protein